MNSGRHAHFDEVWRLKCATGNLPIGMRGNLRAIKALSLLSHGESLLDIGCGTGSFGEAASERFREVHGVDIAADAVHLAQQSGVKAQLVDVSSEPLPYLDESFDAVTALSVLQYVVDVQRLLHECRRVLRPNGQFIVCVPNIRAAWRLWSLTVRGVFPRTSLDPVGVDGGTVHYFTSRTGRELAALAGFDVMAVYGVFCHPKWLEDRADTGPFAWSKREFLSAEVLFDMRAGRVPQASRGSLRTAM